jgi:transcriptional regulator with XRE-family HTH domain
MSDKPAAPVSPFGARLRQWRRHRGLSQLGLAGRVASTARHISFLETGRSRPSRQMVLRLAATLDVGLRESNELLHAAGLPSTYPQVALDGPDLAWYRSAIERMLDAHEPYPAMVIDRHWNVILANRACSVLFGPQVVGSNFVRDSLANPAAAQAIVNWPEVAWAGLDRLRHHLDRTPFDQELRHLVTLAENALVGVARPATAEPRLAVCPWFRIDDQIVRTIAMVARFDPIAEVTLDELRVELMYPLDQAAERFFRDRRKPMPSAEGAEPAVAVLAE